MKKSAAPPPHNPQPVRLRDVAIATVVLAVAGWLVYHNSFRSPFIWDDPYLISENHFITSFRYLPDIFRQNLFYGTAGMSNFYRPAQLLTFMADYAWWGLNPFGYHLTNFLLHVACALLVVLVMAQLLHRRGVALLIGLLFVVHPVNSTVVNYISSRADSLATLCMLLSVWCFWKSDGGGAFLYIASLSGFVLALLSKELAIILPALLMVSMIVLGRWEGWRSVRRLAPFLVVLAVYAALRLTVLKFPGATADALVLPSAGIRLLTAAESFIRLIGMLVVPRHIHIEKMLPFTTGLFEPRTIISLLLLIGLGISVAALWRRSRGYAMGWVWYFVGLSPMTNLVPINTTMADHWLYLPCAGAFLAVIGGAAQWLEQLDNSRRAVVTRLLLGGYAVVIVVFGALTIRQNTIWHDPERFFTIGLQYAPNSFRAHNELGVIFLKRGELERAAEKFQRAIRANSVFDQAYDNLGTAFDQLGRLEEAIDAHRKAIELNPRNPKTFNNLGNAYLKTQRYDQAIDAFESALRLNAQYKAACNNLAAVYYYQGRWDKARHYWQQALAIDPNFQMARENLEVLDAAQRAGPGVQFPAVPNPDSTIR